MKANYITLRKLTLALALISPFSGIYGQDEPQDKSAEDEVINMNPFVVQAYEDSGYLSGNAFSAYRINTPIIEIPFSIQVLNEEFIEDIVAVDVRDLVPYTAGVNLVEKNNQVQEISEFSIRGIESSRPKRNGMTRYLILDTTNVERVEVVKGPASTMYGAAEPGGIINYVTRRPTEVPTFGFDATIGSWNYYRAQLSASGPIVEDTLLYQIDASALDRKGYRDFDEEQRQFISSALEWRLSSMVTLIGEVEYLEREANPVSPNIIYNEELYENGLIDPATDLLVGPTISTNPRRVRWTDINPLFSDKFNSSGPDANIEVDALVASLEANVIFNDKLSARAIAANSEINNDNRLAYANRTRVAGDGLIRSTFGWDATNDVTQFQADLVYNNQDGAIHHRAMVGVEHVNDKFDVDINFSGIPGQRAYFLPENESKLPEDTATADFTFNDLDLRPFDPARNQKVNNVVENTGFYASYMLSAMNRRLNILTGVRRDKSIAEDGEGNDLRPEIEETTYQLGANFNLTDTVTVFANYSESFIPVSGIFRRLPEGGDSEDDIIIEPLLPQTGEGYDIGVKLQSPEGKIAGTISFFDIERQNVARTTAYQVFNDQGEIVVSFPYNVYTEGQTSKGVEATLILTPITHWQTIVNYAHIDAEIIDANFDGDPHEDILTSVVGVPENRFSLWTKYTIEDIQDGLQLGLGFIWSDESRGTRNDRDVIVLDSYVRVDLLAQLDFELSGKDAYLKLNVKNLFDETYYNPGPFLGDPLNFTLGFGMDF
ncbi:MAG: TonB-dependent siderophore receptor [Puniceicoccaceae bacterium]